VVKRKLKPSDGKSLTKIYYDPSHPAGFSSLKNLHDATSIPMPAIKEWAESQSTITKYKQSKNKFPRNKIKVSSINELWQVDLIDMRKYEADNDGYKWGLTGINCFSRKANVIPLKNKSASEIIRALKILFKDEIPLKLQADKGSEFINKSVQDLLKSLGILFFTAKNPDTKAPFIERYNKSFKEPVWKWFDYANNTRWIEPVLPKFLKSYNNRIHSSIKMAPNSVNKLNMLAVYKTLYGSDKNKKIKFKFKVGDQVRIKKEKLTFEKGYETNFTQEIFTVSQRKRKPYPVYKVKDLKGEELDSIFYNSELVKVAKIDYRQTFEIEKVLATKGNKILVKWVGYNDSFNEWIVKKKGL
jgi:Integrase core domain